MVLAAAIVPLALLARYEAGPMMGQRLGDVHVGAATAALAIVFYLVKTLVPAGLSPLYERPPHLDPLTWPFLASGAGVVAITALLLALRRRWPAGLASWLCYLAILGPTLGLVPFRLQLAADRYTYVACLGWAMLVGAGVVAWCRVWLRRDVATPMWALTVGLSRGVVGGLAVLSCNRVQVWRDPRTLWAHAAAIDPRSAVAHTNLGMVLEREGKKNS
jgi:hypothetical protein